MSVARTHQEVRYCPRFKSGCQFGKRGMALEEISSSILTGWWKTLRVKRVSSTFEMPGTLLLQCREKDPNAAKTG